MHIEHNRIKNPNWQEATSCLFTSVAEDLNSALPRNVLLPRKKPASGDSNPGTASSLVVTSSGSRPSDKEWAGGGGGGGGGGWGRSQIFFPVLRTSVWLKNKGGWGAGPSPRSATGNYCSNKKLKVLSASYTT